MELVWGVHGQWNYHQYYFGNINPLETARPKPRTAIGMSLISMILMELAMNLADYE